MDLLFDLDGTLVDSAGGILASMAGALAEEGAVPRTPLDRSLLGPPLRATLTALVGEGDPALLDRLATAFKAHYDHRGCLATPLYPGVEAALRRWARSGHRLFVVTNKRLGPTRTILAHLGLTDLFTAVHALDERQPAHASKDDLVGWMLDHHRIDPARALLVGDTEGDGRAARAHGLDFAFAAYGYGTLEDSTIPVRATLRCLQDLEPGAGPAAGYAEDRPARGEP